MIPLHLAEALPDCSPKPVSIQSKDGTTRQQLLLFPSAEKMPCH